MTALVTILALVLSPIMVGGKRILPFDGKKMVTVELAPEVFDELHGLGVVEHANTNPVTQAEPPESANEQGDATGTDAPPAIDEALLAAITALDPENKAHFTNDGEPEVKALGELVARKVSAAERDDAWARYQDTVTA